MGRFLNADAYASTGQGILGNNMFAYCGNNPVNYSDPTGQAYQGIYRQFNYNEYEHTYGGLRSVNPSGLLINRDVTLTVGLTGTGSVGTAASISRGIAIDTNANVGYIRTGGVSATSAPAPSLGGAVFLSITDAENIALLSGKASQEGISFNLFGLGISIEHSFFEDPITKEMYNGYSVVIGPRASVPLAFYGGVTGSSVYGFNLLTGEKIIS